MQDICTVNVCIGVWGNEDDIQTESMIKEKKAELLFCSLLYGHSVCSSWVVIHMWIWFIIARSKRVCEREINLPNMRKYVFEPSAITDITSSSSPSVTLIKCCQWLCSDVAMKPCSKSNHENAIFIQINRPNENTQCIVLKSIFSVLVQMEKMLQLH